MYGIYGNPYSTSGVSIDMPPPAIPKKKANRKNSLLLVNK
jgi:hypothetical protein